MQLRGWLWSPNLLHYLHTLVWQLQQLLPTTDRYLVVPQGVAATTDGAKMPCQLFGTACSWELWKAELLSRPMLVCC